MSVMQKISFGEKLAAAALAITILAWVFDLHPIGQKLIPSLSPERISTERRVGTVQPQPVQPTVSINSADDNHNSAPIIGLWKETNQIYTNTFEFFPNGELSYVNDGVTYVGFYKQDYSGNIIYDIKNGESGDVAYISDTYAIFHTVYKGNHSFKK